MTSPARLVWAPAVVSAKAKETSSATSLTLDVPHWPGHRAGQHVDIRLTAPDGYQATRSYSLASAPGETPQITVERLDGGEVSPFLADTAAEGTHLEVRGPIGGYFVWEPDGHDSVTLIAGGSGIVPLRSMIRHRRRVSDHTPMSLLYSVRSDDRIIYRSELERAEPGESILFTLTGPDVPDEWTGSTGRITPDLLGEVLDDAAAMPLAFVCGPTAFVEAAASAVADLGVHPRAIRTERFG